MLQRLIPFILLLGIVLGCGQKERQHYVLDELELVPEGIAYSKKRQTFYLSSVAKAKIITLDKESGAQQDFIEPHGFGFLPGVGLLVDDGRNELHALAGYYRHDDSLTALFTFDLDSKKLLKRHNFVGPDGPYFPNDLIMDKKGTLYITDTKTSAVHTLDQGSDSLKLFFRSDEIQYPNGIALSDDDTKLYVASFSKGVRIIDIATKMVLNEIDSLGVSQGIDGLEFYKGHLYAIQNGVTANSFNFRKLELNTSQDKIIGVQVIDSHNKELNLPLTFCIADRRAVVIGNSNLQFLDQVNLTFTEPDSLMKTKLLIYKLGD